jgi:hypothetical protein
MKLKDALDNYYFYSGKLSDICRQLGFAGIAIIWIFGLGTVTTAQLPKDLTLPALLIVASLTLDFLHYLSSTVIWGVYHRVKEKDTKPDAEFEAPRQINWAPLIFFWLKVTALGAAYLALGFYLADHLFR